MSYPARAEGLVNMDKISYYCPNNICKIIDNHNKKLINKLDWNYKEKIKHSCNCKLQNECSLENKCNLNNILYQANISAKENDNIDKAYVGMTSLNWKFRFYNNLPLFRNQTLRNQTVLSKYIGI